MYTTILIADAEDEIKKSLHQLQNLCGQSIHSEKADSPAFLRISTTKGIYNIPHSEILYVESVQKKSIIHTKTTLYILAIPLYRVRNALPSASFIQAHRSYIINLKNISFIDKTKEPWTVSFFDSEKTAFVSRSFRKELLQAVKGCID